MTTPTPSAPILHAHALAALAIAMRNEWIRFAVLGVWGAGLVALTDELTAVGWTLAGFAAALSRRWIETTVLSARPDWRRERLIVVMAAARSAVWAMAPVLIWKAGHPHALTAALLYLAAGFTLYAMQFRSAVGAIAVVCAPLLVATGIVLVDVMSAGSGLAVLLGFIVFAIALVLQIGMARQVEQQMERAAAENRQLIEQLHLAVDSIAAASWHMDFRTATLAGADSMARVYGRSLTWADVIVPGTPFAHPDDQPLVAAAIAAMSPASPRASSDHRVRKPDGAIIWLRTTALAGFNRHGVMTRLSGLTFDITAEKRLELEVLNATREAEAALADQRRLFDDQPPPPATDKAPSVHTLEQSVHHLRTIINEIAVRDTALARMIDDLARARTAAEDANHAKSQFLASMSHELRTPLNAILGYGELLEEAARERGDMDAQSDLRRVLSAAHRLLRLVNDVLDLSKIEAGRLDLITQTFAVHPMVDDIIATVRPMVRAEVKVLVDCAPGVGEMATDRFRLGQCLLNLLSNAAKFTREGVILVAVRRESRGEDEWMVFSIKDSGIGIAAEKLAKLFQPFSQADADVAQTFGGTGLGLVITRRLARIMGGDVTVESTPGVGSTFLLAVPVRLADAATLANAA